jgi:mono/diheme cytochrome c family protein
MRRATTGARRNGRAAAVLAAVVWISAGGCSAPPAGGVAPCPPPPDAAALAATGSISPAEGDAARGAAVFERECNRCHAPRPEDRASRFFHGYPRLDCADYRSRAPAGYLHTAIASGGPAVGRDEAMKPFADVLSEQEIADLVAFLREGL